MEERFAAGRNLRLLFPDFLLAGAPYGGPGNLVRLFRPQHTHFPDLLKSSVAVFDQTGQAPGNVGVIEPQAFPDGNATVSLHLPDVLPDLRGFQFHSLHNGAIVQNHGGSCDGQGLLNHHPEVVRNLRHIEPAQRI